MVQRDEVTSTRLQQSPEEELRIRTKPASGIKRVGGMCIKKENRKEKRQNQWGN